MGLQMGHLLWIHSMDPAKLEDMKYLSGKGTTPRSCVFPKFGLFDGLKATSPCRGVGRTTREETRQSLSIYYLYRRRGGNLQNNAL